jgi:acyl-CoA thioesterase-2
MPPVPGPDELPTFRERIESSLDRFGPETTEWLIRERPIESRPVDDPHWIAPSPRPAAQDVWIRANGELPDDPLVHACVVAYASDLTLLDTATLPHAIGYSGNFMMASLDHAMWFHRPFRADEWLLYHQLSPSASGARVLALGHVFRRDGDIVVTVMQEGLIRPIPTPAPPV